MKQKLMDILAIMMGSIFMASAMQYKSAFLLIIGAVLWYITGFYAGRKYEKGVKKDERYSH